MILLVFLMSCDPLFVVVQYHSSEQSVDFDSASKFANFRKIFKSDDIAEIKNSWLKHANFKANLGRDKRFSNQIYYHNYDLLVNETDNGYIVHFVEKGESSHTLTYRLEYEGKP